MVIYFEKGNLDYTTTPTYTSKTLVFYLLTFSLTYYFFPSIFFILLTYFSTMSKTFKHRFTSPTLEIEQEKLKRVKFNRKNTDCVKCRWGCIIKWIPMRVFPPFINKNDIYHHFLFWASTERHLQV